MSIFGDGNKYPGKEQDLGGLNPIFRENLHTSASDSSGNLD